MHHHIQPCVFSVCVHTEWVHCVCVPVCGYMSVICLHLCVETRSRCQCLPQLLSLTDGVAAASPGAPRVFSAFLALGLQVYVSVPGSSRSGC